MRIKANITAYSTAVGPSSLRRNRRRCFMVFLARSIAATALHERLLACDTEDLAN
jgi:hypothetical protein